VVIAANDDFYVPVRLDLESVLVEAGRRAQSRRLADELIARDWPALIDGE